MRPLAVRTVKRLTFKRLAFKRLAFKRLAFKRLASTALIAGALIFGSPILGPKPALAEKADGYVLYRGVTVIDVVAGAPRPGLSILTHGERIEAIGAALTPPPGTKVVGVAGLYASPGLINSHEHLATPPDRPFAEAMLAKDLYGGITAIRDMADDLRQVSDLARATRVGELAGPDIYSAALMAGPTFFEDPRVAAASQGETAGQVPWMQAVTPATDLRLAVAQAHGTGAIAIKIYADLPASLVAAITQEAHRQGMLVWAHAAVFPASPQQVIDAGVDSISHSCMLAYQASDVEPRAYHHRAPVDEARFANTIPASVEALFADIKARGAILDATLRVYVELAADHAAHPKGPAPYCSAELAARLTQEAYKHGVLISTGTDGFSKTADPWPALQDELELLQTKAGLAPADVVRAATLTGAMTLHKDKEMGELEAGKLANMVFTAKNPLADVRAYRSVVLTVKRGAAYWRKDYRAVPLSEKDDE